MFKFFTNFILLSAAFALAFFWIRPEWKQISSLRAETKSYQETLDNLQTIQKLRDKLIEDYNSVSDEDKKRLSKLLPYILNKEDVLVMIESLIKSNGLFLKTISFESPGKTEKNAVSENTKKSYGALLISMDFAGSYSAFKNFLKDLEQNLLITDADNISFSSNREQKEEIAIYNFKITVKMYWEP